MVLSNGKITCWNNAIASDCILACCLLPLPSQKLSNWNKQSANLLICCWGGVLILFFFKIASSFFSTNHNLRKKKGVRSGGFFFSGRPSQASQESPGVPGWHHHQIPVKALLQLAADTGRQVYLLYYLTAHPKMLHRRAETPEMPLASQIFLPAGWPFPSVRSVTHRRTPAGLNLQPPKPDLAAGISAPGMAAGFHATLQSKKCAWETKAVACVFNKHCSIHNSHAEILLFIY